MSNRYRVDPVNDPDGYGWALNEIDDTGNVVREVNRDGGEPEDQLLVRDWKWVPEEMNKLAARAEAAERKAETYERDWYEAKTEFGAAMAKARAERDALRARLLEIEANQAQALNTLQSCRHTAHEFLVVCGACVTAAVNSLNKKETSNA